MILMETLQQDKKKALDNCHDKRVLILGSYKAYTLGHHETRKNLTNK